MKWSRDTDWLLAWFVVISTITGIVLFTGEEDMKTETLKIYGSSDDTIGAYGLGADGYGYSAYSFETGKDGAMDDYDTCAVNNPPMSFRVIAPDGQRIRVHAIFDGCWSFAIGMVQEGEKMPDWPQSRRWEGYTEIIEMEVPTGTRVVWENDV